MSPPDRPTVPRAGAVTLPARPENLPINPSETALIVVDMQNAYASPGGYLDIAGFDIGAGARYVGHVYGDSANTIRTVPYTIYDAALAYDFSYLRPDLKGWQAQLNATNLFDKYYVTNCATALAYCGLGAARTVLFTLKYRWQEASAR